MRILFLTQVLPYPLDAGPKTRAYYVLRHLARRHHVTLVSFTRREDQPQHLDHLREICHAVHTVPMQRSWLKNVRALAESLTTGRPLIICRDRVPEMTRLIRHELAAGDYDAVHADQISMAQYGLLATQRTNQPTSQQTNKPTNQPTNKPANPPTTILDAHNALFLVFQRLAQHEPNPVKRLLLQREARLLARYETETCQAYDQVVCVTEEDRVALIPDRGSQSTDTQYAIRNTQYATIPICIDPEDQPLIQPASHPKRITFLGALHWPPNAEGALWFVRKVWPRVHQAAPDAVLTIIGKHPPAELTHPASRIPHPASRNVEITGYVEDPSPYLAETAAFIVPLHSAGGMRVKILDAWCWGLPIVSTTVGAEGINYQAGENILIADAPAQFAAAVVRLLASPEVNRRLRVHGRRWVETHYDWRTIYPQWDDVYRNSALEWNSPLQPGRSRSA